MGKRFSAKDLPWRDIHRFVVWIPLALPGSYVVLLGLLVQSSNGSDQAIAHSHFTMWRALMAAPLAYLWCAALVGLWLWAYFRSRSLAERQSEVEMEGGVVSDYRRGIFNDAPNQGTQIYNERPQPADLTPAIESDILGRLNRTLPVKLMVFENHAHHQRIVDLLSSHGFNLIEPVFAVTGGVHPAPPKPLAIIALADHQLLVWDPRP